MKKDQNIDGVEIRVIVYESLDDALNKEIEDIVVNSIHPYKVLVKPKIEYMESTRYFSQQLEKSGDDVLSLYETILKNNSVEIIRLIGTFFLCLVMLFGIVIIANLAKGPLLLIAESFRNFAKDYHRSNNQKVNDQKDKVEEEDPSDRVLLQSSYKFKSNLKIFKDQLIASPEEVNKIILSDEKGMVGIRKLVPYIYEKKYLEILKGVLSKDDLINITDCDFKFESEHEFYNWFNSIIENLTLKFLSKTKTIIDRLPTKKMEEVLKIDEDIIIEYAKENETPLGYHIALDTLKGKQREIFITNLEIEQWKDVISTEDIDNEQILAEVEDLIEFAKNNDSIGDEISSQVIKTNLVLPSLLKILPLKTLKIQDNFVQSLSGVSKNIMFDLRENYWTPRNILEVPVEHLKEILRDCDVDQKFAILKSMPSDVSQFLESVIPEGRVKEIILDRLKDVPDETLESKFDIIGKEFINKLFTDYKNAKFKIEGDLISINHKATSSDFDSIYNDDFEDLDEIA